jgi:hypothetical protein
MLAGQIFGHNYYWIFGSVATPDLTTSGSVCASRVTALTVPATATREHALIADAVRLDRFEFLWSSTMRTIHDHHALTDAPNCSYRRFHVDCGSAKYKAIRYLSALHLKRTVLSMTDDCKQC